MAAMVDMAVPATILTVVVAYVELIVAAADVATAAYSPLLLIPTATATFALPTVVVSPAVVPFQLLGQQLLWPLLTATL